MRILLTLAILLLATPAYAKTPTEVYDESVDAIVEVTTNDSYATGFFIKPHYILTNAHAVDGMGAEGLGSVTIEVHTSGKEGLGKVLATFPRYDMAVVYTSEIIGWPLKLESRDILVGEQVVSIGNPGRLANSLAVGHVAFIDRSVGLTPDVKSVQLDITSIGGSSGSPILDMDGDVIALLNAGVYGTASITYAIPVHEIQSMIDLIVKGHHRGLVR